MLIEVPLLVTGRGPAAIVVAKVASGWGLASLLAGHEPLGGDDPVVLSPEAVAVLTPNGAFEVLRPYLASLDPPSIAPVVFEEVLKHHCVADLNVTVYDGIALVSHTRRGAGVTGVLSDGRSRWEVSADAYVDAADLPSTLPEAITAAAEVAASVLAARR